MKFIFSRPKPVYDGHVPLGGSRVAVAIYLAVTDKSLVESWDPAGKKDKKTRVESVRMSGSRKYKYALEAEL